MKNTGVEGVRVNSLEGLLARQEILKWWSAQRQYVTSECAAAADRYTAQAHNMIDELSLRQIAMRSQPLRHVERQIESNVNIFRRRIATELKFECEASFERIEGNGAFHGLSPDDAAMFALGGVTAAASVGVAGVATTFATTSTATMFMGLLTTGTVVTFSWPVFAAIGTTATGLAWLSPTLLDKARGRLRQKLKAHVTGKIRKLLLVDDSKAKSAGTLPVLLAALDAAKDARMQEASL